MKYLKKYFWVLLLGFGIGACGFRPANVVSHDYISENYQIVKFAYGFTDNDLNKNRIVWKIFDLTRNFDRDQKYFCQINKVTLSNTRVATNATGDADSYKLMVKIDYTLQYLDGTAIKSGQYSLMDIYQVDQSLYSAEVKYDKIVDTVPKSFVDHIYRELLLVE